MATPPRVTAIEADSAVERITRRRRDLDDPEAEMIGTDPRDVLDHLHKHPTRVRWAAHADTADAVVLLNWLWWEDRRRRLAVLRGGRRHGMTLAQLGSLLGIRTRQGVQDVIDRLTALLRYDRPDEKITRTERRLSAPDGADARHAWIDQHGDRLRVVAGDLLAEAIRWNVADREWLDELAADHRDDQWTPATMAVLGLAVAELRTAPAVSVLDTRHGVHTALAAADQLRAAYAQL